MVYSMTELDVLKTLAPIVGAAIGSLIAGFGGVWFGLARLRKERAFDRRLAWYEQTVRVIYEIVTKSNMLFAIPDLETRRVVYQQLSEAVARFGALTAESKLYCGPAAYSFLAKALDQLAALTLGFSSGDEAAGVHAHRASIDVLLEASDALAADVRAQLGLKQLPPGPLRTIIAVPSSVDSRDGAI
jgi:hypothetical protein